MSLFVSLCPRRTSRSVTRRAAARWAGGAPPACSIATESRNSPVRLKHFNKLKNVWMRPRHSTVQRAMPSFEMVVRSLAFDIVIVCPYLNREPCYEIVDPRCCHVVRKTRRIFIDDFIHCLQPNFVDLLSRHKRKCCSSAHQTVEGVIDCVTAAEPQVLHFTPDSQGIVEQAALVCSETFQ